LFQKHLHKKLKVGITGGIGSGKTTVCRIFETLGIPVYYADDRAKMLMVERLQLRGVIESLFGTDAYSADNQLNRAHIAAIAFQHPEKLKALNAAVHPAVLEDGEAWHFAQNAPYTLKEAALLFESGSYMHLDKIITVFTPVETRIERVLLRGGITKADIEARIAKQMPDDEKVQRADFVIYNDGAQPLIPQVLAIHRQLLAV
jgi:dephospho-CoA kinase